MTSRKEATHGQEEEGQEEARQEALQTGLLMQRRRLIIHCLDVRNGRTTLAREVDRWHAARGDIGQRDETALLRFAPQYPYCGYHGIIYLDGSVERTRAETENGSHCAGHNSDSLGFALVGRDKYTLAQWEALAWLVTDCQRRWGELDVGGHNEYNSEKTCPGFSVKDWLENGMQPLVGHVLQL